MPLSLNNLSLDKMVAAVVASLLLVAVGLAMNLLIPIVFYPFSKSIWAAVEENIGYRQLNAWWRIGGALEALRDTPAEWGNMQRRGFTQR